MSENYNDAFATGVALNRMIEADLARPRRAMNARPVQQPDGYTLGEMIPQAVQDCELAQAAIDFSARQEAKDRLIRSGAADMPTGKR